MTTPATEGAPAPVVTTPPAPAATTATPPAAAPPAAEPAWLPDRLARAAEQERQKVLTELGVSDPAKAKKLLEDAAKAEEEKKSQGERLGETSKALETTRAELARQQAATKEYASRMMLPLTEAQRTAVKAGITAAGGNAEDPAAQIGMIGALQSTWATAPAPPAATPPAPAAPTPPASGTAPPPNAPPATNPASPPNHREVHAALLKTNPFAAAEYAIAHVREVFPESQP